MGAEATGTLRVDGEAYECTALLESDEIRFRGDLRLKIPLAEVREATASDGTLRIEHAGGTALFTLGPAAAKWADRIRSPRSVAEKLGVKPGMAVAVIGIDDEVLLRELSENGAMLVKGRMPRQVEMVLVRITSAAGLARLPRLAEAIAPDGVIWVVHPRGVPAVADTVIFAAARKVGLVSTKVARISDTDTAEKLVIPVAAR